MKYFFTEPHGSVRRPYRLLLPIPKEFLMHASRIYLLIMISALWAYASPGNGQTIEDTHITVEFKRESLKNVFDEIEKQSGFFFLSSPEDVSGYKNINLPKGTYPVGDVLRMVLEDTNLKFTGKGKYVMVYKEEDEAKAEERLEEIVGEEEVKALVEVKEEIPMQALVTGTVKDATNNEPLAGVNIIVKGTTRGTTTDKDGKFAIDANDIDILVFSFIGYKAFQAQVSGKTLIEVSMERDITALEEVEVNAGYWRVSDKEKTGNISRVGMEQIQVQPISNPLQALQGRVPGVYVQQATGIPGGGFNIQIRGRNSIRNDFGDNGNLPLYIIDGVPFTSTPLTSSFTTQSNLRGGNPLSAINPSDIESIEILKDADATAIYGSRGSNGVVLITTKKGKAGKAKFDFNIYKGIGKVSRMMELLNTEQYIMMRKEAFKNDGAIPTSRAYDINGTWDSTRYTDWQKEFIGGTAESTSAQASISGGNEDIQVFFGAGYFKETTVFPGDFNNKKGSINLHTNYATPSKKFNLATSVNYVNESSNIPSLDMTSLIFLPPNAPRVYNDDGSFNWDPTWPAPGNPFANLKNTYDAQTDNLISNANLNYEIIRGLVVKSSFGFNRIVSKSTTTNPLSAKNPINTAARGSGYFFDLDSKSWIIEPQLEYKRVIGVGTLTLLVGETFQQRNSASENLYASGYTNDSSIGNLHAASEISILGVEETEYKYNALFGRINYDWRNKYIINLTGRRDGSSRFGPNNRFSNFGAVGLAWILSEERFIKNSIVFLSHAKLRSSYGITGSDQILDYGYFDTYGSTAYDYHDSPGLVPLKIANPGYSWEKNRKFEAALELSFYQDRIQLNTAYYRNRSSSQLVGYSLAPSSGFSSVQKNFPATVQNTGLEVELTSSIFKNNNFSWATTFNLTVPANKLVAFPNIEGSPYKNLLEVGEPLTIRKLYHYTGVDAESGLHTVEDVNADGIFNSDDYRTYFAGQKFYGGLVNAIRYRGLKLEFLIQFVKQTGYDYFNFVSSMPGSYARNQPTEVLKRWQSEGDITDVQKFTQSSATSYFLAKQSNYSLNDASFIRLKNLSLCYAWPSNMISKLGLSEFKMYLQAQNLLTVTDYVGADPETLNAQALSTLRMIVYGIQFNF